MSVHTLAVKPHLIHDLIICYRSRERHGSICPNLTQCIESFYPSCYALVIDISRYSSSPCRYQRCQRNPKRPHVSYSEASLHINKLSCVALHWHSTQTWWTCEDATILVEIIAPTVLDFVTEKASQDKCSLQYDTVLLSSLSSYFDYQLPSFVDR